MIAALQMYDWTEVQDRTDRFWSRVSAALSARGIDAPAVLFRPEEISSAWSRQDLLLGQTCGLPYVSGRCGNAVLVGRPDYGIEGAFGGCYSSVLICRAEDEGGLSAFRGRRGAINDLGSQSGCNALADEIQRLKLDGGRAFFGEVLLSGAHRASATLVADRKADVAAIDAVAWALFRELDPVRHARLRVIGETRTMPALPFITSRKNAHMKPALLDALLQACAPSAAPVAGIPVMIVPTEDDDYDPVRKMAHRVKGIRLAPNLRPL